MSLWVLILVLIAVLPGVLPLGLTYNAEWGYGPAISVLGILVIVLIIGLVRELA
ncbi:DUF3309 family protein [Methylobacterium sp. XJLW]|uniref:DUF3309 family protein n=1 Tax=Methylobacterium sp. XJLW TaxID=739141 RepID=UPI000DACF485|nr:DUF3309 family protein [Methylobacterium sp. XJLW]